MLLRMNAFPILFIALVMLMACQSEKDTHLIPIGENTLIEGYELKVQQSRMLSDEVPGLEAGPGKKLLAIELIFNNTSSGAYSFMANQYQLMDQDSVRYNPMLSGMTPHFGLSGQVAANLSREGWLTYEVPENAGDFQLVYQTDIIGGDQYFFKLQ